MAQQQPQGEQVPERVKKVIVRFNRLTPPYRQGEEAAFSEEDAQALIDSEVATFVEERWHTPAPPRRDEPAPTDPAELLAKAMKLLQQGKV